MANHCWPGHPRLAARLVSHCQPQSSKRPAGALAREGPGRTAVCSTARAPTNDGLLTPHVVRAPRPKPRHQHQHPCHMRCTNIAAFGVRDAFHRWVLPGTTPRWRLVPGQEGRHESAALPPRITLPTRVHAYEYALDRMHHRGKRGAVRPHAAHRLLLPKRFSNTPACTANPALPAHAQARSLVPRREGRATSPRARRPGCVSSGADPLP
jgi:hypothetical protein